MACSTVRLLFMLAVLFTNVIHGLPAALERRYNNENNLDSTSILGTAATTQSNATSAGPGSIVEISGIVSGEASSSLQAESVAADGNPGISSVASQVNCSEYSTSSAEGASSADALASGDCLMNIDNNASHNFNDAGQTSKDTVTLGSQVSTPGGTQSGSSSDAQLQEGWITQATVQNPDGSTEAYQFTGGPQVAPSFAGLMANANSDVVTGGMHETLLLHTPGDTNIQTVVTTFGAGGTTESI